MKRFEIVLARHGLNPDDYERAKPIFSSKTPEEVIANSKKVSKPKQVQLQDPSRSEI